MKRLAFLVVVLVAALTAAASAMAAPAPKATGDYGYSFGGVQRHLTFNAIQSKTDICGTFWNVTGITSFVFDPINDSTNYAHNATLTQNGQSVGGSGSYTGSPTNTWIVNPGSTVVGDTLTLTWNYTSPADLVGPTQYVMTMQGTITNGSISGQWSQTGGASGTFTSVGSATAVATYCGKGNAYYSDETGAWYFMNVEAVSVDGDTAWYAAKIIASNLGFENLSTNYLFVKVIDNDEPGVGNDVTSGDLMTEAGALAAVAGHGTPSASAIINLGNIQVH